MKSAFMPVLTGYLLACLFAGQASAGFSIEGSPTSSSERTSMGVFTPYEQQGQATFRQTTAGHESKQARYLDAELLVDLAYRPVTQVGSGHADIVNGFGDDLPFKTAMTMIMPNGWQLYRGSAMDKKSVPATVSFIGGRIWPDVLTQVAEGYALSFHIDWNQRTVMMNKGREGVLAQAKRINIIPEPPRPSPVRSKADDHPSKSGAKAVAVPASAPLYTSGSKPKNKTSEPVVKSSSSSSSSFKVTTTSKVSTPDNKIDHKSLVEKQAKPTQAQLVTIDVLPGTLRQNVERLSKINGWENPQWKIRGDYQVVSGYTLKGKSFAEAMAKLLMLHPIEADVNVGQRTIYVLKEVL